MRPLLAIDLGASPAIAVVMGSERAPVLLETRQFSGWDSEQIAEAIAEVMERRGIRMVYCEETFTERRAKKWYLADVGRVQEAQAGYLEGWLFGRGELRRVSPVNDTEAWVAWGIFGSPQAGKGAKGEHVRDALGVGLKALIEESMNPRVLA